MNRFLQLSFALLALGPCLALAKEPVIGGPCEGCQWIFESLPAQLASRSRIAPSTERGQPLVLEGVVKTLEGKPAPGVIVYAYHTNDSGIYPKSTTPHGRLRGWVRTDPAGRYRFDTIRPSAYPTRDIPAHVHMHVLEPGKGTYYIDDVVFDDDPLLTPARRTSLRRGRGGDGVTDPKRDQQGVWHVRRDITLGSNIPGYP